MTNYWLVYGDNELFLEDSLPDNVYHDTLMGIPHLKKLVATHQADCPAEELFFMNFCCGDWRQTKS